MNHEEERIYDQDGVQIPFNLLEPYSIEYLDPKITKLINDPHIKHPSLDDVFRKHCSISIDRTLLLKTLTYVNNFTRRDENSISFWGGGLIGCFPVKWTRSEEDTWITDILEIDDYNGLIQDIYSLPGINKSWKVSSNAINLSFLWIVYEALISAELEEKDREALARAALNMLQYKFITSLHTHRFKYVADINISIAVYEQLNNKTTLKKEGSWQGLVDARTTDILGIDSLHTKTIRTLRETTDVVKTLNDIWNRLKSIFNILTTDFHNIKDTNAKFASTTKFTIVEGESIIKDSFNEYAHIKRNMHVIIPDRNSFIREDLMEVVTKIIDTVYPRILKTTLIFISENFISKYKKVNIPDLVDEIIMYSFNIIREEHIDLRDLTSVALKFKNLLRSSRVIDPEFIRIKEQLATIIYDSNEKITDVSMASARISVTLYIILLALLKK